MYFNVQKSIEKINFLNLTCLLGACCGSPDPTVLWTLELGTDLDIQPVCTTAMLALSFFSLSFVLRVPVITSGISWDERILVNRFIGPEEPERCCMFGFNQECANGFVMQFNCCEDLHQTENIVYDKKLPWKLFLRENIKNGDFF